jgi:hypothetical protein
MKFYRYESRRYSVTICPDREIFGTSKAELQLIEFKLHSETPKGHWIGIWGGKDTWVSKTSKKRYAHPSKDEALQSYVARKKAFVRHSKNRLRRAEEDLALVEKDLDITNTALCSITHE